MIRHTLWATSLIVLFCLSLQGCKEQKQSYQATSYVEAPLFYVSSPVGANLKELSVHEGQQLTGNEKLFTLEKQESLQSPAAAKVISIFYKQNEFVPAGSPIVSLFIPTRMQIIFYVPESNLAKIKVGNDVSLLLDGKKYPVTISYIAKKADYAPDAFFSKNNHYKLIYKVKAKLTSAELRDMLKIGQSVTIEY